MAMGGFHHSAEALVLDWVWVVERGKAEVEETLSLWRSQDIACRLQ